jgi:hypothetical protein
MPYERAEQPLSYSALEDTGVPALDGDHDGRVGRGYLFICMQPTEPWDMWRPRAGSGSPSPRGHVVAPSREQEPKPRGHMAASELPSAGRREPLSWLEACARGVPGPQGTDTSAETVLRTWRASGGLLRGEEAASDELLLVCVGEEG